MCGKKPQTWNLTFPVTLRNLDWYYGLTSEPFEGLLDDQDLIFFAILCVLCSQESS